MTPPTPPDAAELRRALRHASHGGPGTRPAVLRAFLAADVVVPLASLSAPTNRRR